MATQNICFEYTGTPPEELCMTIDGVSKLVTVGAGPFSTYEDCIDTGCDSGGCQSFPTVVGGDTPAIICDPVTTMTINGTGFSTTADENTVVFSSGVGAVTASTATTLTISFSTHPSLGVLTAIVTTNLCSSAPAVQVADVVACGGCTQTVDENLTNICQDAGTLLTITGSGFGTDPGLVELTFSSGEFTIDTIADGEIVFIVDVEPDLGELTVMVTIDDCTTEPVIVATVLEYCNFVWNDTFTDSDGTLLEDHTPDLSPGGVGYYAVQDGPVITSNTLGSPEYAPDVPRFQFDAGEHDAIGSIDFVINSAANIELWSLSKGAGAYLERKWGTTYRLYVGDLHEADVELLEGVSYTLQVICDLTNFTMVATCNGVSVTNSYFFGGTWWTFYCNQTAADAITFDNLRVAVP